MKVETWAVVGKIAVGLFVVGVVINLLAIGVLAKKGA